MRIWRVIPICFLLSFLYSSNGSAFTGEWGSTRGEVVFFDDNRGPIPYDGCRLNMVIEGDFERFTVERFSTLCVSETEFTFRFESDSLAFKVRDGVILENGRRIGSITKERIRFDYADEFEGTHYVDIFRRADGLLRVSWAWRSDVFPGFDISAVLTRQP